MKTLASAVVLALASSAPVLAAPATYTIDPNHTYPSFEGDHMGGVSVWRGKFDKTSGTMTLDKEGKSGTVDVTVDLASVDFGMPEMNDKAKSDEFFDVAKFPTATYKGKLAGFSKGFPTKIEGDFTLHGVTKPLALKINSFKCIQHPMYKKELCGADVYGTFQRDQFGLTAGKDWGFDMTVTLRIQVETLAAQ